jgi:hypothetical protein
VAKNKDKKPANKVPVTDKDPAASAKGKTVALPDTAWAKEAKEVIEGLNEQQTAFVLEYVKDLSRVRAYRAAYGEHLAYYVAASSAYRLLKVVEVRKAVRIISDTITREYCCDPAFIMRELAKLAHANIDDFIQIGDDGSVVMDFSLADRDKLGAIEEITTEEIFEPSNVEGGEPVRGRKVKIKLVSKRAVLMDLAKVQKMFSDNFSPRAETAKIMQDLEEGTIDTLGAAYRFTALGLPLPEIIKIQLTKGNGEGDGDDDRAPKSDEELNRAYNEAMANAEKQRTIFLPDRQQQVLALKEELKAHESFDKAVG